MVRAMFSVLVRKRLDIDRSYTKNTFCLGGVYYLNLYKIFPCLYLLPVNYKIQYKTLTFFALQPFMDRSSVKIQMQHFQTSGCGNPWDILLPFLTVTFCVP